MMQKSIILAKRGESVLQKSPVGSFPVVTDKKLSSIAQVVGDFSLIPTTAMDLLGMVGSLQLEGIKIPTGTKSAKKGWRLTAKW